MYGQMYAQEEAQAAIRALSGFRLGDRYLVLQIHNPKRMFKVDKIDDTQVSRSVEYCFALIS
jgi:hypothetical protein